MSKSIISALYSIAGFELMVVILSSNDKAIVMPVASIIATTHGRIPESIAFTPEYFSRSFIMAAMIKIITNEGNTTPRVAIAPPMKPARTNL